MIKRFEVSKRLLQNLSLFSAFILFAGLLSGGLYGVMKGDFADVVRNSSVFVPEATAQTTAAAYDRRGIDYSRPDESDEFSFNSGGPVDPDELESDNAELEKVLRSIQANANPNYIPNIWPHASKINNEFGFRRNPFGGRTYEFHAGMDIDGERGDMVVAPGHGTVSEAGYKGGYGNMIEVDHGNGLKTRYGHLSRIDVEPGTPVSRGQVIGQVGSTGRSTGPHLHYELRVNDRPINPRFFLPVEPTQLKRPGR